MSVETCPREHELLRALGRGFVAPELEEHAAGCSACGELRTVARALLDDRSRAVAEAPVPSPGTVWWRLRLRQRRDAEARARRSLVVGQAATLAVVLALVVAFFGSELASGLRELAATVRLSTPLLLAFAAWVVLTPVAGWIVLRQE